MGSVSNCSGFAGAALAIGAALFELLSLLSGLSCLQPEQSRLVSRID